MVEFEYNGYSYKADANNIINLPDLSFLDPDSFKYLTEIKNELNKVKKELETASNINNAFIFNEVYNISEGYNDIANSIDEATKGIDSLGEELKKETSELKTYFEAFNNIKGINITEIGPTETSNDS